VTSILLARWIAAAILAADLSRALLVCGLLLSPIVAHDAVLGVAIERILFRFALSFCHGLLIDWC